MTISDVIEKMLIDMLRDAGGALEIRRNNLASELNCVPSQINYVISTRFTPERGYVIESRRGGGGSVKIRQVGTEDLSVMHLVNTVGDSLTYQTATVFAKNLLDYGYLTEREAKLILSVLSDNALPFPAQERDAIRASLFKTMLMSLA